jgi:enoyl-CoA hydratase/carnithine racemase
LHSASAAGVSFVILELLALDIIEQRLPKGVVITTSTITKFYSNGLDYENAIKDPTFFSGSLFPLWRRLITYPMPTVALLNGHAFAGGLMTAMMHDYRIMNPHKGFVCLNELDFPSASNGSSIPHQA